MPAVHALPGAGKTYAVREAGPSGWLLDSDDLFRTIFGVKASKAAMDAVFSDPAKRETLVRRFSTFGRSDSRFILLSNVNPDACGALTALRIAYTPDDYVPHLRACGRHDLLDRFGEDELRGWAADHVRLSQQRNAPRTIWLNPGQFVSDVVAVATQDFEDLNRAADRRYALDAYPYGLR